MEPQKKRSPKTIWRILLLIGIPVAFITLSVGTVILVRKRKHAK
jgi:hypothetical protein